MITRQIIINTYPLIFQRKFSTFEEHRSKFPIFLGFLFNIIL